MTTTKTYDTLLRRSSLALQDSSTQFLQSDYSYDDASRLSSVGTGTNVATYAYLANSPLVEQIAFTHGNTTNMVTTKAYDYINRLTAISHADLQPVTLASYSYGYNGANQRTNVTHADDSYWTFGYDSLGQVISGKQRDDQDALLADRQFEYDFDDIGNRQAHRLDGSAGGILQTTNTYAANLLNQNTNIAGASPDHDADGNLSNDTNWVYTWNGENRLVVLESSTNVPAGSRKKLGFAYDHQGRRTSKTVSTWNSGTSDWDLSYQRYFIYDGWNLIDELDGKTTVVNSVVWGLDLSDSEQGAGGVGGLLMLTDSGADTHFVGHDGNGNVTRLVDSSLGTITASYEYSPFGKRLSATGTMSLVNPFRLSNKYEDDESGFNYYGYRYYNPDTGRWLNRDPVEEEGGKSVYVFIDNLPNVHFDVLGLIGGSFASTTWNEWANWERKTKVVTPEVYANCCACNGPLAVTLQVGVDMSVNFGLLGNAFTEALEISMGVSIGASLSLSVTMNCTGEESASNDSESTSNCCKQPVITFVWEERSRSGTQTVVSWIGITTNTVFDKEFQNVSVMVSDQSVPCP